MILLQDNRWYQDSKIDVQKIPAVEAREAKFRRPEADLPTSQHLAAISCNPLQAHQTNETTAPPATQTVPSWTVFHIEDVYGT